MATATVTPIAAHKTLLEKLSEVMAEVRHVEKRGENQQQHFSYVKAADVAAPIRKELVKRGIILVPDIVEQFPYEHRIAGKKEGEPDKIWQGIHIKVKYTFHDSLTGESLSFHGFGTGVDSGDKAIYKAQTGAWKYAVRMFFALPDEKGDPEFQPKTYGEAAKKFPCTVKVLEVKLAAGKNGKDNVLSAKCANELGEVFIKATDEKSISALLDSENTDVTMVVFDTLTLHKGLPVFRVLEVNPSQEALLALTKGGR